MSNPWNSATPLSNADFKALLTTPRPDWAGGGGSGAGGAQRSGAAGGAQQRSSAAAAAKKESKPFKAPKPRPKPQQQQGDDDGPKYRDRAKERRDGVNLDYEDAEVDLVARGLRPDTLDALSIEDSKFLGGDMAHTHLVKGLDYALLQQERLKQQQQQQKQQQAPDGGAAAAAVPAAAARVAPSRDSSNKPASFITPTGRALYAALFNQPTARQRAAAVREMFLPRRLAFAFELDDGATAGLSSELPTTLRRSAADCPPPQDLLPAGADSTLLGRVGRAYGYVMTHLMGKGGQRKPKRQEHSDAIKAILAGSTPEEAAAKAAEAAAAAAAASEQQQQQQAAAAATKQQQRPVDDDDDIFGDAGTDYVPEIPVKKRDAAGAAAAGDGCGSYFDKRDDMADLPPPPPTMGGREEDDMDLEEGELAGTGPRPPKASGSMPPPPPIDPATAWAAPQQAAGGAAGASGAGEQRWRPPGAGKELSAQTRALLKQMGEDAYGEYFPEAGAAYAAGYGSDEEGADGDKKKGAASAAGGEEDGAAAGKGGKGRPAAMTDERRREQKLDGQLGKIKQLFEEKGFGNAAAFKKPEKLEVAATPARKRPRI